MRGPVLALILLVAALARAEEPRTGRIVGRVRLAGPPLRIMPAGWRCFSSDHGVFPGTSSQ